VSGSLLATLLALVAALMHASWNAAVKSAGDRLTSMAMVDATALALCLLVLPFVAPPGGSAWIFLTVSTVLNTVYKLFLVKAYQLGDFGQMYPIMRGVSPLVVALISVTALGQHLTPAGWTGAVLISLGVTSLVLVGKAGALHRKPVLFALSAGLAVAGYTASDAAGVHTPDGILRYVVYLFLLESVPLPALALAVRKQAAVSYLRDHWRLGLFGGVNALLSYLLILYALSLSGAARVESLRESSVLLASVIGTALFKEPFGRNRLYCAALVTTGILLVGS
jgi:drug/metabolite transporter (DMT)-like permease